MPGYFNSLLNETTSAQAQQQMFSATDTEFQGSLFEDVLANSPTSAIVTGMDLAYANDDFTFKSSETLNPQEANEKYGLKGELKFSSPIKESAAKIMYDRKYYELQRREVLGQGTSGQNLVGFGTGMAATLIDPLNIALSLAIPPVAEMKLAGLAGSSISRQVGAKAVGGALDAGLAVAAGQGLTAAALNGTQADYTMTTALRDTAMGMVLGGAVHGGLGTYKASRGLPVTDFMSKTKPETQLHAQVAAANDLLNGRAVTSPEQLVKLDENLTRAGAENSAAASVLNQDPTPRDPLKPSGPKEAPQFFDPEFKFRQEEKPLVAEAAPEVKAGVDLETQAQAINNYLETSEPINGFLRGELPGGKDVELDVAALDEALNLAPETGEMLTVYRVAEKGVYTDNRLDPGSVDKGFLSGTTSKAEAKKFAEQGNFDSPVIYEIQVPAGTKFLKLGNKPDYPYKTEVLLPRGAKISRSISASAALKRKVWEYKLEAAAKPEAKLAPVPDGYERVVIDEKKLNLRTYTAGAGVEYRPSQPKSILVPKGAVTPDTVAKIISNNKNIRGQQIDFNGFNEIYQFFIELGLKEEDFDPYVVEKSTTKSGQELRGIQTNAQLLVGEMRNFVIRITDVQAGQKPELEIPGLTTVSIRNKTFKLKMADFSEGKTIKVDVSERVYLPQDVAAIRYYAAQGKAKYEAIEALDNESRKDATIRAENPDYRKIYKRTVDEAYHGVAKKAVMANMSFGDLHAGNIGARLADDVNNPGDFLVLDKGAPRINYRDLYNDVYGQGRMLPNKNDPAQKIQYDEYKRIQKENIDAANRERLEAHRQELINKEQIKIIREQLDNLKQQLQKKPESTWWKPGDEAPVETAAKETVTQDSLKAPQDLERDFNNLSMDTEEFINRFKNEMSETDLAKLAEFDKLAGDAEKAKPGFAQAALCVIRNLV